MSNSSWRLRRMIILAMIAALACVVAALRVPIILWFEYEAKDVLLAISGFLFGTVAGCCTAVTTAVLEYFIVPGSSDTGVWGLVMNILASCVFVFVSSIIYRRKRSLSSAIIGLLCAVLITTGIMLLWDYLIIPLYTANVDREAVAGIMLSVLVPFNFLKCSVNAALTMLIYKPITNALRSAKLLPPTDAVTQKSKFPVWLATIFVLASLALVTLIWLDII